LASEAINEGVLPMMVPFQLASLPVTPWKNGGGETREIICVPAPDAPFLWRASIATLQADGPFSPFPGVDRVITLLAGQPLRLCGENINQPLALWQPWAFPGEWALSSVGIVEPGLDFNIMTQRGRASATVQMVSSPQHPATDGVAYVLQGEWDLAGRRCAAGSGLCWRGESPGDLRPLGSHGRLLLAEIALK